MLPKIRANGGSLRKRARGLHVECRLVYNFKSRKRGREEGDGGGGGREDREEKGGIKRVREK